MTQIDLSSLDSSTGAMLNVAGNVLASAGDLNDDGIEDVLIGDSSANQVSVVFGSAGGFPATITQADVVITGQDGDAVGDAMVAVDVNADGVDDLLLGAAGNERAYLLYGSAGFGASGAVTLATLAGAGDGLQGTFYDTGLFETLDQAELAASQTRPDLFFTSTALNYPADQDSVSDSVGLKTFLGDDAPANAPDTDLTGSVFTYQGYLDVPQAGTYTFQAQADDGFRLRIGDQVVIEKTFIGNFSKGAASGVVTFDRAGLVPIAFTHWETGGSTGAILESNITGEMGVISQELLYSLGGFVIDGAGSTFGQVVADAGDVNGDGVEDLLIGAPESNEAVLVFGAAHARGLELDARLLDGRDGTVLTGPSGLGQALSGAGDVNHDGYDDVLLGLQDFNNEWGEVIVVFGAERFTPTLDVTTLDVGAGLSITGLAEGDQLGTAVSGLGDISDDGIDDFAIGAPNSGSNNHGHVYVVHGSQSLGATNSFNLSHLNGVNGFGVGGSTSNTLLGESLAGPGDVNGDGVRDVLMGQEGKAKVVFGAPTRFDFKEVDVEADTVTFTQATGLETGDAFIYTGAAGAHVGGLVPDTRYHAIVNGNSDRLQFAATTADAAAGVVIDLDLDPRFLADAGTGTLVDSGQRIGDLTLSDNVALGDVDGDGDIDALVVSANSPSRVYLNQGGAQKGVEGVFTDSGQALGSDGVDVVLGDVDEDGDLDAFVVGVSAANQLFVNQGGAQGGVAGVFVDSGQMLGGNNSTVGVLGDVDGDGDLDVVLANIGAADQVFLNQGGEQGGQAGVFLDSGQMIGAAVDSEVLVLGDVDGDGDLDTVILSGDSEQHQVYLNQGGAQGGEVGVFAENGQGVGPETGSDDVVLGDIEGDGDVDALFSLFDGFNNQVSVWLSQTQAGQPAVFVDSGQLFGIGGGGEVVLGDLNGDHFLDLVVSGSDGTGLVYLNEGSSNAGQFVGTGQTVGSPSGSSVALGDVDGDGTMDAYFTTLALATNNAGDRVWLGGPSAWTVTVDEVADTFTFNDGTPSLTAGTALTYQAAWGTSLVGLEDGETYYLITPEGAPANTIRVSPEETGALSSNGTSNLVRFHEGSLTPGGTHYLGIEGLGITQPGANLLVGSESTGIPTFNPTQLDGEDGFAVSGVEDTDEVGAVATGVGDIDGDGFDDFVVGGTTPYLVYGFHDPDTGNYPIDDSRLAGVPITVGGGVVSRVGDVNGDGLDDLVVGDPTFNEGAGAVSVVFGSVERFAGSIDQADAVIFGEQAGDQFGASLVGTNLNNDQFDDLVIGAPGAQDEQGHVYVLFGMEMEPGVAGSFYDSGQLSGVDAAVSYIEDNDSDATFVSTEVNYPRNDDRLPDANTLSTYLEDDAASLIGTDATSLDGSVFTYDGFLVVETAGAYQFQLGSDDQARLTIDGDVVVENSGGFNAPAVSYTFNAPGNYALSLVHNEKGGSTGVNLQSTLSGTLAPLTSDFLVTATWDLSELDGTTGFAVSFASEVGIVKGPLAGAFYDSGELHSVAEAVNYIDSHASDATFVSTEVNYPRSDDRLSDANTLSTYLEDDTASLIGTDATSLDGSVFTYDGFLVVETAGTYHFTVGADDGARLTINGDIVADNQSGFNNPSHPYTFDEPGMYTISLVHFEIGGATGVVLETDLSGSMQPLGAEVARLGLSVGAAGDVNGDTIADVIVGAPGADAAYVVFGSTSPFTPTVDVSDFTGKGVGATLQGSIGSQTGISVGGAGDVDGDGLDDVIVGAPGAAPNSQNGAGQAYLVFGTTQSFPNTIDLTMLDGTDGVVFNGVTAGDGAGMAVAGVGDLTGDGFDDLLIGAPFVEVGTSAEAGVAYLLFGSETLGDLSGQAFTDLGSQVLAITGPEAQAHLGATVAALGDINGDKAPDLMVGAPDTAAGQGRTYTIFGIDPNASHLLIIDLSSPSTGGVQKFEQNAKVLKPTPLAGRSQVIAWGSEGSLLGGIGANVTATLEPSVRAFIGATDSAQTVTNADITAEGAVFIEAFSATDVKADAIGNAFGLLAGVGQVTSTVKLQHQGSDSQMVHAYVGSKAQVVAQDGDFTLVAESHDTVDASTTANYGALVAGGSGETSTTLARTTLARIGPGATVTAEGDVQLQALKTTNLLATATSASGGIVVSPEAMVTANLGKDSAPTVEARIDGNGTTVTSQNGENGVVLTAGNSSQDSLTLEATSWSAGGVSQSKSIADLKLNEYAEVVTIDSATLSGAQATLSATLGWDEVKVATSARTRSLVGIPVAKSTLEGTVESRVTHNASGIDSVAKPETIDNLKDTATVEQKKQFTVFWIGGGVKTTNGSNKIVVLSAPANTAPQVTALNSDATEVNLAGEGDVVTLIGTFEDPDLLDVHTVRVVWGDGQVTEDALIEQGTDLFSVTATHMYQDGGIYPITLEVTDRAGLLDTAATTAVVSGTGVVDGVLHIIATNQADTIEITDSFGVPQVQSSIDGYFQPDILVDSILIRTFDGNDRITISGDLAAPAIID
ncbi:MAG: hypothetical protein GY926_11610, partial [bacterium]|nr:hypothetical protein [bacterium]